MVRFAESEVLRAVTALQDDPTHGFRCGLVLKLLPAGEVSAEDEAYNDFLQTVMDAARVDEAALFGHEGPIEADVPLNPMEDAPAEYYEVTSDPTSVLLGFPNQGMRIAVQRMLDLNGGWMLMGVSVSLQ